MRVCVRARACVPACMLYMQASVCVHVYVPVYINYNIYLCIASIITMSMKKDNEIYIPMGMTLCMYSKLNNLATIYYLSITDQKVILIRYDQY